MLFTGAAARCCKNTNRKKKEEKKKERAFYANSKQYESNFGAKGWLMIFVAGLMFYFYAGMCTDGLEYHRHQLRQCPRCG